MFRELHKRKPIFLLGSTGGATKILATKFSNVNFVRVIDNIEYQKPIREKIEGAEGNYSEKFDIIPYSFITGLIVNQIIDNKNN